MNIFYYFKFYKWFFFVFLTGFKISACGSEDRNNRATDKEKQGYYFHRYMKCLFQKITPTIKSGFERYTKKIKILTKIFFF